VSSRPEPIWKDVPDHHDFRAAWSYLSQHFTPLTALNMHNALTKGAMTTRPAKDIIRASMLRVLPPSDPKVQHNLKKIADGKKLSPVLLVVTDGKTFIADGFHRCCAIYNLNYDDQVPCIMVWLRDDRTYVLGADHYDPAL